MSFWDLEDFKLKIESDLKKIDDIEKSKHLAEEEEIFEVMAHPEKFQECQTIRNSLYRVGYYEGVVKTAILKAFDRKGFITGYNQYSLKSSIRLPYRILPAQEFSVLERNRDLGIID